jgi:hypothetical protein
MDGPIPHLGCSTTSDRNQEPENLSSGADCVSIGAVVP